MEILQNLIFTFIILVYNYCCLANDNVKIGPFFNDETTDFNFNVILDHLHPELKFEHSEIVVVPEEDSFSSTKVFCKTISESTYTAIMGPRHSASSQTIQSICETLQLPYLGIHWVPIWTKDNGVVFNLYPDSNLLAQALAVVIKSLDWDRFIIIYEDLKSLARLQDVLKLQSHQPNYDKNNILIKRLGPGPDYRPLLKEVTNMVPRRIILDCSVDKIIDILRQGKEDAHTLDFENEQLRGDANVTTIRLFNPKNEDFIRLVSKYYPTVPPEKIRVETALQHDAMMFFTKSINSLKEKYPNEEFMFTPTSCNSTSTLFEENLLIKEMRDTFMSSSDSITGEFHLDNGKRYTFTLEVIETNNPDKPIGIWNSATPDTIFFTRNATERERELQIRMQNYNFIVSSKLGKPYLMESGIPGAVGNDRYRGFSMDLITEVAKLTNITFQFVLDSKNSPAIIVDDLVHRRADLGICDFTITQQRSEQIDFSLPFMSLGISILHKEIEQEEIDNMYGFMRPFYWTVWVYIITLYLTLSIIILIIARLDPDDWENPHPCNSKPEELENIWGFKNCLWLTLGSIMTQGCDILPKGLSSRIATAMWWFFSLIMASTYTANLAAFLTMSRKDDSIKNVDDLANQNKVKYGMMSNGATQAFFENSNNSLYQRMWAIMKNENPSVFEESNDKGVDRVLNTKNGLYAFFMESPQIEYERERHCGLTKIGQLLDSKSYGIGMPLGADYRHEINAAVLKLQENGKLNELKEKWWKQEDLEEIQCKSAVSEDSNDKLTLANVGGIFVVLAAGIGLAFIFALIEFLWNVHNISIEEHMTYLEALKCELKFACNIRVTRKAAKPSLSEYCEPEEEITTPKTVLEGAGSFLNVNATVLNRMSQQ
ncbi:hypothetical protein ABEB36_007086 [Hypothenemus hampei]|uniref:Uncharacterized protein n=1 Tax=Hypothenemus hampei TaxID=57062 RepID=A0ABD1ETA6_HYPHA